MCLERRDVETLEDFELFTISVHFSKAPVPLNLKLVATWLLHEIGNSESLQWRSLLEEQTRARQINQS